MSNGKAAGGTGSIETLQSIEDILSKALAVAAEAERRMLAAKQMLEEPKEQHQKAMDEIHAARKVKAHCLRNMQSDAEREYEISEPRSKRAPTIYYNAESETSSETSPRLPIIIGYDSEYGDTTSSRSQRTSKTGTSSSSRGSKATIHRSSSGKLARRRRNGEKNIWGQSCWR